MLISYSHKFIFIHLYKVAGTSVRHALAPYTSDPRRLLANRILGRVNPNWSIPFYRYRIVRKHLSASHTRDILPRKIFDQYYKFAFVRNPWDWQVSLYHFILATPEHFRHKEITALGSFDAYLEWRVSCDRKLQRDFLSDPAGKVLVDFVGRYENLHADFSKICHRVGIEAELPHLNQSVRTVYRDYYNKHTRKLIEDNFAEDIETFGYKY